MTNEPEEPVDPVVAEQIYRETLKGKRQQCFVLAIVAAVLLAPILAYAGWHYTVHRDHQQLICTILLPICALGLIGVELNFALSPLKEVPTLLRESMANYRDVMRVYRYRWWTVALIWVGVVFAFHIQSPQWMLNLGFSKAGLIIFLTPIVLSMFSGPSRTIHLSLRRPNGNQKP